MEVLRIMTFTMEIFGRSYYYDPNNSGVRAFLSDIVDDVSYLQTIRTVFTSAYSYALDGNYFKNLSEDKAIAHILNMWRLYKNS